MAPETFAFPTGEQAFIWLGSNNTLYVTGTASRRRGELYQFTEQAFNGTPSMGWVGLGGGAHCGQSLWDAQQRRVQFLWLRLSLAGANYTGAQTIPREIVLAPPGSVSGLAFRPIPEMATLHTTSEPAVDEAFALAAGARRVFSPPDGLHCHVKATIAMPRDVATECSVVLAVRDGNGGGSRGADLSRLQISLSHTKGQRVISLGGKPANISLTSSTVELELFVDGVIVELFVNGGKRAMVTNSGNPSSIAFADTKISISAADTSTNVTLQAWGMQKAISGP
jgi:sucrose-6-phosphate hydrolase SacC (GH32 family)